MKKLKIALWLIIIGFIVILFLSNKDYFLAKQVLQIDLLFSEPFHTAEMPNVIFFLVFFLAGFLVSYFISLSDRFKLKKTNKKLNAAAISQLKEIVALKKEVEKLQGGSSCQKAEPGENN